jgi:hypothetical protein
MQLKLLEKNKGDKSLKADHIKSVKKVFPLSNDPAGIPTFVKKILLIPKACTKSYSYNTKIRRLFLNRHKSLN